MSELWEARVREGDGSRWTIDVIPESVVLREMEQFKESTRIGKDTGQVGDWGSGRE